MRRKLDFIPPKTSKTNAIVIHDHHHTPGTAFQRQTMKHRASSRSPCVLLKAVVALSIACVALARPDPEWAQQRGPARVRRSLLTTPEPSVNTKHELATVSSSTPGAGALPALLESQGSHGGERSLLESQGTKEVADTLESLGLAMAEAGAKSIPKVGNFISAAIGFLFGESSSTQSPLEIWLSIKSYVEEDIKAAVDTAILDLVDRQLQGISGTVRDYRDLTQPSPQKTQAYTSITEILSQLTPQFTSGPTGLLAYLTPFGTIRIGFIRELVINYTDIYGVADTNAAANQQHLTDTIQALTDAVNTGITNQITERLARITRETVNDGDCGIFNSNNDCGHVVSQDTLTGFMTRTWFDDGYSGRQAVSIQDMTYLALRGAAEYQMEAHLDALTEPARLWRLLDPTQAPKYQITKTLVIKTTGTFGGKFATTQPQPIADEPAGGPNTLNLTSITINSGDSIDGIQFAWGGVPGTHMGGTGGANHNTLTLDANEYINRVQVGYGDFISYLVFYTNTGRTISGGYPRDVVDIDFSAPTLSVYLCGVGGQTGNMVQAISFTWCYIKTDLAPV